MVRQSVCAQCCHPVDEGACPTCRAWLRRAGGPDLQRLLLAALAMVVVLLVLARLAG